MNFRRQSLFPILSACALTVAPGAFAATPASGAVAGSAASSGRSGGSGGSGGSLTQLGPGATSATPAAAVDNSGPAYGSELQGFNYPAPVEQYDFTSQGVALHMAYMDIKPAKANGRTAVLLDRKSTRLNSSHQIISYAVFCLKKKKKPQDEGIIGTTLHCQGYNRQRQLVK